ncbi:hypothetical protein NIES2100_64180 [Calothrix sp. NIES-2100]|uniref:T3SS effector HopA1 family protein n=1 Tax=Calothrix sp. NIES-2100 TaxID=1954172 RepID=UPI000B5E23AE|nr:hypothetical protein NIES2100_64180 [Calothrix sp. NIES-2100]
MMMQPVPFSALSPNLQDALQHLVENIHIQSAFCIHHPNYGKIELVGAVAERFGQLPQTLQDQYLLIQLQNLIYSVYYNGLIKISQNDSTPDSQTVIQGYQDLENNTLLGVDTQFYDRLHEHNTGVGYFDPGWAVIGWEDSQTLMVKKKEITLHLDPERHLHPESRAGILAVTELVPEKYAVPVLMPKNRVQNGFYMAVGNAGIQQPDENSVIVRIYFNITAEGAVMLMQHITQNLNQQMIPFSFKVLYNPSDYKRYDAGVLYFHQRDFAAIWSILQSIDDATRSHFRSPVPLFTKPLAPGLGLAQEPDRKFAQEESFGMHRCRAIAQGLLSAYREGKTSVEQRLHSILQQFAASGVDLRYPYLNSGSTDYYEEICRAIRDRT